MKVIANQDLGNRGAPWLEADKVYTVLQCRFDGNQRQYRIKLKEVSHQWLHHSWFYSEAETLRRLELIGKVL